MGDFFRNWMSNLPEFVGRFGVGSPGEARLGKALGV